LRGKSVDATANNEEIVEAHGGEVSCESGSTFRFTIDHANANGKH
jgi:hypothetical protein